MVDRFLKHKFVVLVTAALVLLAGCAGAESGGSTDPPPTAVEVTTTTDAPPTTATTTVPEPTIVSAYFVGNSLTGQTLGPLSKSVRSLVPLARQADVLIRPLGWHIKCGSSLLSIAANPDETCADPDPTIGGLDEALSSGDWDFLVVQPYPGAGSTLASDVDVIGEMAQALPSDATVLVFTGWPRLPGYTSSWDSVGEISDDSPTKHSRLYFNTLVDRLTDALDQHVELVPSGEVLYRLQPRLVSGDVPGVTSLADLYSDEVHLNARGAWLSGVTAAAVLTGADVSVFGKPSEPWYGDNSNFSKEFIQVAKEVVAEVLSE